LSEDKKQQVIALGLLDWSLRRIEAATGVRRETAAGYLRAAGIALRPPGGWGAAGVGKTGQRTDHRLWRGVGRLNQLSVAATAGAQSIGERLRTVPRID